MNILIIFFALTAFNVIFSTVKSITTVRGSPPIAALVNATYYAYYNAVLLYTVADFPLWQKMAITFLCNLIGVYVVKLVEQKARKERLWKIEATFDVAYLETIDQLAKVPHSYIKIGNHVIFNFYAENKQQSAKARDIVKRYKGKYFVTESKIL